MEKKSLLRQMVTQDITEIYTVNDIEIKIPDIEKNVDKIINTSSIWQAYDTALLECSNKIGNKKGGINE